jgi:peptide deformylase
MAVLKIKTHPDKILLERAPFFALEEGNVKWLEKLLSDMADTMEEHNGLGLAAPQVGVAKKILIYKNHRGALVNLINPHIVARSGKVTSHDEGCLSCPDFRADVKRSRDIVVSAWTFVNGRLEDVRIKTRRKFEAIKLQHEIDHVNGVTIMERAKR